MPLFPPITPYSSGFLAVDSVHTLYWEQSGNPDGVPVVLLHGGPGAGASPVHRCFFDPKFYRIIIFDQRGAGRSTPLGELRNNTRMLLVDDMEKLREHLRVEQWHVFGGSWGSTLALSYAISHPSRCISLILRGIFLLEQNEVDWFMHGMKKTYPEAFDEFIAPLTEKERKNILPSYYKRLCSNDSKIQREAGMAWAGFEGKCARLIPLISKTITEEEIQYNLAVSRLECHYFIHEVIAPKKSLLLSIDKIRHIPSVIIHGRYDVICPLETAHKLHKAWPEADYVIVPDGGHSAMDPAVTERLLQATERAKTIR